MDAGKKRGKLVSVTDGRGYHIAPLSHSYAVLLPEVASLLEDMGQAFADQLEGTPSAGTTFRVTSLTRTARQQDRLGRRNYNAIQEASTHSYGASFDIAYTDRPSNEADCSAPTPGYTAGAEFISEVRTHFGHSRTELHAHHPATLEVNDLSVGSGGGFHDGFTQGRVRVNGFDEFMTGGF